MTIYKYSISNYKYVRSFIRVHAKYRNKQIFNYVFGLLFLYPQSAGDCFTDELSEIQPMNEKLTKFTDYLIENYIHIDPIFSPEIWSE
jgi:hypothetical protein